MDLQPTNNTAFVESLKGYSLSELEDIYSHLDRDNFSDRFDSVKAEIELRLSEFDSLNDEVLDEAEIAPPGILRRISSSLVDFSVQVLVPFLIFVLIKNVLFPRPQAGGGGGGRGGRGGRGGGGGNESNDLWSDITGFVGGAKDLVVGLAEGDPAAQATAAIIWNDYGTILQVLIAFRVFMTLSGWSRSGYTPGMRELGIKLERFGGDTPTFLQTLGRFILQPVLFVVTLGMSGLWMFWDRDRRALHDKIIGTRLVRIARVWEKAEAERRFD
ncbi:MAG: RDD family protein [Candidatus Latescibacteria bacterium]|jgi:hypothetical protein|nr:RDD family protein [Candidatus Latescibacterota bacterium]